MAKIYHSYVLKAYLTVRNQNLPSNESLSVDNELEPQEITIIGYEDPAPNPGPLPSGRTSGYIYAGVRLEQTLYKDESLQTILGITTPEKAHQADAGVSIITFYSYKDAARCGLFGELAIIFEAKDPNRVYAPWGKEYKSHLCYNFDLPVKTLARKLYNHEFKIGPDNIVYKPKAGKISVMHKKRTSPTL